MKEILCKNGDVVIIRVPKGNKESDQGDQEEARENLDHLWNPPLAQRLLTHLQHRKMLLERQIRVLLILPDPLEGANSNRDDSEAEVETCVQAIAESGDCPTI